MDDFVRKLGLALLKIEKENKDVDRYLINQEQYDKYMKLVECFLELKKRDDDMVFLCTEQTPCLGVADFEVETKYDFSINGEEDMKRFAEAISACSAMTIDIHQGKIRISMCVPGVYMGLLPPDNK